MWKVLEGDAVAVMATLGEGEFDAIVTDPPYGWGFMGQAWDTYTPAQYQAWCQQWAREAYRVLKPGGHLAAFGGARTYHRLAAGIEDAGFEIRDSLHWVNAADFPKSLDVSKAIDKAAGAQREVTGAKSAGQSSLQRVSRVEQGYRPSLTGCTPEAIPVTAPATEAARQWAGFGTAVKPAHEPIVLARKPLAAKTVAANVLEYGTGALNIDGCRVGAGGQLRWERPRDMGYHGGSDAGAVAALASEQGRWPANVLFSHQPECAQDGACAGDCPVAELDRQSGTLTSGANLARRNADKFQNTYGAFTGQRECVPARGADSGGASRFFPVFRYQAKAPKRERPSADGVASHVAVKPVTLMRWLVRLLTPPGGRVLDMFAGTGTTAQACHLEGFDCVLVERDPGYRTLIGVRMGQYGTQAA